DTASLSRIVLEVDRYGVVLLIIYVFFFQAEDGIRDLIVTGVQTCALPISLGKCRKTRAIRSGDSLFCERGLWRRVNRECVDEQLQSRRIAAIRVTRHTPSIFRRSNSASRRSQIGRASCRERG